MNGHLGGDVRARLEALAPWAAGLLLAAPVLVAYYPPMTDLPYHEGAVGILRYGSNAAMFPAGLYERNLGHPNQLFHLAGWVLSYVVPTRWAVKLLVAASIVAVPVGAARFARHLGSSPLAALVVAPAAVGWLFAWGLVANIMGLSCFLAVLPGLDRFERKPTVAGALLCTGSACLLYEAHEAMLLVFGGAAFGLAILHRGEVRARLLRLVPFALCAMLSVGQILWQASLMSPTLQGVPTRWDPVLDKVVAILDAILPITDTFTHVCAIVLTVTAIESFLWLRARERRQDGGAATGPVDRRPTDMRQWALDHRWELVALACVVTYLAFPSSLNGATLVCQRWLAPGFAVLAVASAPRDLWTHATRVAPVALVSTLALVPLTFLATLPAFEDSNRNYLRFEEILDRIAPDSAVAGVALDFTAAPRRYALGSATGRVLAVRGGRLAFSFTDFTTSPVVLSRRYRWSEPLGRIGFDSAALRPSDDLRRFRYLVAHVTQPPVADALVRALAPEARLMVHAGEWMLFESRLGPTLPLLSSDLTASAGSETLRQRFARSGEERLLGPASPRP